MAIGFPGAGATGGSSPLSFDELSEKYYGMSHSRLHLLLGGKELKVDGEPFVVDELNIELTAGYEASVASFRLYNVYEPAKGTFRYEEIQKMLFMGAIVNLALGYLNVVETVFIGFVAGVSFGYAAGELPYIEVSCMDIKGLMMANSCAAQLKAKSYGEAVREVFTRPGSGYEKLKNKEGYTELQITDTPDKNEQGGEQKAVAETIEMVTESDYEFVVRSAKRFNYEFFADRGIVFFRKAKSNTAPLIELAVGKGIISFRIEYSITGIVGQIEARAIDSANGKLISSKMKLDTELSTASSARGLVSGGSKVFVDPSIVTTQDADARVDALMERMSYRLGSIEAECFGIPELCPGRFVTVSGMAAPGDNDFYVTRVTHTFTSERGYRTTFVGCADKIKKEMAAF